MSEHLLGSGQVPDRHRAIGVTKGDEPVISVRQDNVGAHAQVQLGNDFAVVQIDDRRSVVPGIRCDEQAELVGCNHIARNVWNLYDSCDFLISRVDRNDSFITLAWR